jgi:hypothetical protein
MAEVGGRSTEAFDLYFELMLERRALRRQRRKDLLQLAALGPLGGGGEQRVSIQ